MESIFYSSRLKSKKDEKAQVFCSVLTIDKNTFDYTVDVYPWRFKTVKKAMQNVSKQVATILHQNLNWRYNDEIHEFSLTRSPNGYTKLVTGAKLKVRFSDNLHRLFGLSRASSEHPHSYGVRHVRNLVGTNEQLFLLSNIVKPTAYGQHRLQILQSFVYERSKETVIEKRFQPITYLPLKSNSIDMIQLQVTDINYEPVNLPDATTIVCLYFRKIRSS